MELIISPWKDKFIEVVSKTKRELFISSPFIDVGAVELLSNLIQKRSSVELSLITNLTTHTIVNKITDPKALIELYKQFNNVKISSLGKLHAKVYLIDSKIGIITSANLTIGGLVNNFEYGVLINNRSVIRSVKEDMLKYYSLGNILDMNILEKICIELERIEKIKNKTDNIVKNTKLAQLLRKTTDSLNFELLKNRIKGGKTINAIFSETILYLLKKKGPLSTKQIHPLIQAIHPDICDDNIDRVINGQHFGKKWKHLVRSAQQSLKKKGLIFLKNNKWHLVGHN